MIKLKRELLEGLDTLDGLKDALQQAIMLEHSTIPTYLYALYSIKPGANQAISALIESVVVEEMLHMALASNILNAIGGSPVINRPGFIPSYPGPLPGGVDSGLTVPLAGFSIDLVEDVFMEIEEPEDPLDFRDEAMRAAPQYATIGEFYAAIKAQIVQFGDSIFVGDPAHQVPLGDYYPGVQPITKSSEALAAIDLIVEQGEGTPTSPLDLEHDLAHYYRFAEIYHGKTLIPNPNPPPNPTPDEEYVYGGDPIPFDAGGVQPVVQNPKAADYPDGSMARTLCDTFNYSYTTLLNALHDTFNGQPDRLGDAIGIMESLKQQAMDLMAVDLGNGTTAGPSFEYQPVNP
ncbi:MAG TPA: ferritin-like protein [Chloroflexia bacterium]